MNWSEAVIIYIGLPAVLGLGAALMKLWRGYNPSRQESHYKRVHDHAQVLVEHGGKLVSLEDRMREMRGQGERIKGLEVEVRNIKTDTGEMRLDLKELLRRVKINGKS